MIKVTEKTKIENTDQIIHLLKTIFINIFHACGTRKLEQVS